MNSAADRGFPLIDRDIRLSSRRGAWPVATLRTPGAVVVGEGLERLIVGGRLSDDRGVEVNPRQDGQAHAIVGLVEVQHDDAIVPEGSDCTVALLHVIVVGAFEALNSHHRSELFEVAADFLGIGLVSTDGPVEPLVGRRIRRPGDVDLEERILRLWGAGIRLGRHRADLSAIRGEQVRHTAGGQEKRGCGNAHNQGEASASMRISKVHARYFIIFYHFCQYY